MVLLRSPWPGPADYVADPESGRRFHHCASAGFFEAIEVQDCLNLLKVLDNPQRDIEMAAVLRSPIFGVTDTELAKIRALSQGDGAAAPPFMRHSAPTAGAGLTGSWRNRLRAVYERLRSWRQTGPGQSPGGGDLAGL